MPGIINLQTDRHAFFAGKTRSGKTVLVQSFLNTFSRVVVHDPKGEWGPFAANNHYYIVHTPPELGDLLQRGASRIIYQPSAGDEDVEGFNDFCEVVFHQTNLSLIIDEAADHCQTGKVPRWTKSLLRLGNGKGLGVISLTQRPRDVSNVLISESVIIVAFRLELKTDRTKIMETVGTHINHITYGKWSNMVNLPIPDGKNPNKPVSVDEVLRTLPKWHFLLYDSEEGRIAICAPVSFGGNI